MGIRGNKPVVEKIVPSSGWTQDSNSHYLHVYLPEFKKEQVQIFINSSSGHVKVSGERATNQNKNVRFDEAYKVPAEKLDWEKITARFDGEFLHVTLPKQVDAAVEKKRDDEKQAETAAEKERDDEKKTETAAEKERDDEKQAETAAEKERDDGKQAETAAEKERDDEKQAETAAEKERDKTSTTSTDTMEKKKDVVDGTGGDAVEQTHEKPHDEKEVKKVDDDDGQGGQIKKEEKLGGDRCRRLPEDSSVKKVLEDEEGYLRRAMKTLSQSQEIIVTAILAFSLGVLLSRSFPPKRH